MTHDQTGKAIAKALLKVGNLTQFAKKHELALRTLYNLRDGTSDPTRSTLKLVGAALLAEGLLKEPAPRAKKTAGKKKAAA